VSAPAPPRNPALKGIHFLLTYKCDRSCDHCFVYSGPQQPGTFTLDQVRRVLDELPKIGTIESVFFEGGEPFLFYPLMLEGIRLARRMGFAASVVTNCYWATCQADAELWLRPLAEAGVRSVTISDDLFHHEPDRPNPAELVTAAANALGIAVSPIRTEPPFVTVDEEGRPSVGGGVMFRGRAAEKLVGDLPRRPWTEFTSCPAEDLRNPGRVHVDAYGHVHLCQGLSMGNLWRRPLSEIVSGYDPDAHPICGPLLEGGPARLAVRYRMEHAETYISACHLCYEMRRALRERFPDYLAPPQVYGL